MLMFMSFIMTIVDWFHMICLMMRFFVMVSWLNCWMNGVIMHMNCFSIILINESMIGFIM